MRKALVELASKTCEVAKPQAGDLVLDIGCNDGTLLRSFPKEGLYRVGFEPAENLIEDARKGTDWIFNDFFSGRVFRERFGERKARIVTSAAMFYDLEDPNSFVSDVAEIMAPNSVWAVQQNYLGSMLENNGFDNIGHEHLEYYSLATMQILMSRHGLEVFDVETNNVNGGSFCTLIGHSGQHKVRSTVSKTSMHEAQLAIGEHSTFEKFAAEIEKLRDQLHGFITEEVKHGKVVYVYGASNRGNTILQYCGLDHNLINKAADANPDKWGRKTVGTLIPIVSKEEARNDHPDYFLVLPHHFLGEIVRDEKKFLENGGKLILPLPRFRVVSQDPGADNLRGVEAAPKEGSIAGRRWT